MESAAIEITITAIVKPFCLVLSGVAGVNDLDAYSFNLLCALPLDLCRVRISNPWVTLAIMDMIIGNTYRTQSMAE